MCKAKKVIVCGAWCAGAFQGGRSGKALLRVLPQAEPRTHQKVCTKTLRWLGFQVDYMF